MPAALATVLGTALSILLAVRANTAYQRWWSLRLLGADPGASRTLVRVAVAVTNAKHQPAEATQAFQQDLARRQVAYLTALRLQLRHQLDTAEAARNWPPTCQPPKTPRWPARTTPRCCCCSGSPRGSSTRSARNCWPGSTLSAGSRAGRDQHPASPRRAHRDATDAAHLQRVLPLLVHIYVVVFPFAVISSLARTTGWLSPARSSSGMRSGMIERIGAVVEARSPRSSTTSH